MYVCASIHECVHRSQNRLWTVQELELDTGNLTLIFYKQ